LRHPTIREGSRAQGFPDSWIWPENKTDAWTLIGNAVSPPVAKAIGLHLCKLSDNKKSKSKQTLANTRIASYIKAYRSQEEDENPPTLF
jgi:hypothetical protein